MVRRVTIQAPGDWRQLRVEDVAPEAVPTGHARVGVKAIGVNYADVCVRMGVYSSAQKYVGWPITPGFEVAGEVTEVGSGISDLNMGDEVMAVTRFGGYASELVVPRDQIMARPAGFEAVEMAAGFPVVHLTAWYGLVHQAHAEPGESVLIHSAAGGVGGALCALAKAQGCAVTGVVGREEKISTAYARGADHVICKATEDLWERARSIAPDGFDIVLDANGVETLRQSYTHLAPEGRLVIYGFHTMLPRHRGRPNPLKLAWHWLRTPRFNPIAMTARNVSVSAFNLSYLFERRQRLLAAADYLSGLAAEGLLTPPVTKTFRLEDVADAHRELESGMTVGKLVLIP